MRMIWLALLICTSANAQVSGVVQRPKLVVGIVVDQMRWDYLYRYYDRYKADGGFRRLITQGYSCENTLINYMPTYTACGHSTLYTGSVPAIHGITGNNWWEIALKADMYCTQDDSVEGVGGTGAAGKMSPKNMLVTSICDELKMATNFKSKVIGISIKDRGSILPAGHSADAAYWFDGSSGNWISSTYYMKKLPEWVERMNDRKLPEKYFRDGWNTLYPIESYLQRTPEAQQHVGLDSGKRVWPYHYEQYSGKGFNAFPGTPFGNTITKEMAMAAVDAEDLGKDNITDFLAVSFSSTDYIGHAHGPNSIEVEDTYLRLDQELGQFFRFLDQKIGKGQYLIFLSADHAVAHSTDFAAQHKLPGGGIRYSQIQKGVDSVLKAQFGSDRIIEASANYQFFYNYSVLDSLKINRKDVSNSIVRYLQYLPGIFRVFDAQEMMTVPLPPTLRTMLENGYYPPRTGDLQIVLKSGYMNGGGAGSTHGAWNPYDSHIPLIWYGWKVKPGKTNRETYMTDVAPTIAAMLKIQMPSGNVGKVIDEIVQ